MKELLRYMALGPVALLTTLLPAAAAAQEGAGIDPETLASSTMTARVPAAAGLTPGGGPGSSVVWGSRFGWKWISAAEFTADDDMSSARLVFTQGEPGYTSLLLLAPPDEVTHVWEPGSGDLVRHVIRVIMGQDTTFAGCAVLYQRQVAPGPDTATFDDVPETHPLFQHIEALVATGVTSGCDANSYCPGAPLTRGQMAVFLAKALGMGYPG